MKNKKVARQKRARRGRAKIKELLIPRLCVFRSSKHIYAQIISGDGNAVSVTASTWEKDLRSQPTGNAKSASKVGSLIAERAKAAGFGKVAFDRSGYKYHGRIRALADAAREGGLQF
jgi:large subunit ribosomal protein L18